MKKHLSVVSIFLLSLFVVLAFSSCQSIAEEATSIEVVASASNGDVASLPPAPVEEPAVSEDANAEAAVIAEVPAEAESEAVEESVDEPVIATYSYLGYSITLESYDGYGYLTYPAELSNDDVAEFFASEVTLYGDAISGLYYEFKEPGIVEFSYPEGISKSDRRGLVNLFALDAIGMAEKAYALPADSALTVEHSYMGYSVKVEIGQGNATLNYPADMIETAGLENFFAAENATHAGVLDGIYYTIGDGGTVTFTYPETVEAYDIASYVSIFVSDLIAYFNI